MPAVYDQHGVRFLYPENWRLQEELEQAARVITLETPGGGFWSVHVYPPDQPTDRLVEAALATMRQEYQELEAKSVEETIGGYPAAGYDLTFYCLDFVVVCRVRSCSTPRHSLLLLYQAEDREFDALEAVFSAITLSLLASPPSS